MAREKRPIKTLGRTAKFYRKNKDAREKHRATNRQINMRPSRIKYRSAHIKARRQLGIEGKAGKNGPDVVKKNGKWTTESIKINRARGGAQRK